MTKIKKRILYAVGSVFLLGALAFGYYAISPFFINTKLNEEVPGNTSEAEVQRVTIVDTPGHPASGSVRIVEANGRKYVRYEDYKTINGPDIYVYLAKDIGAKDFVDLGRVKATEGNINYEIPAGLDLADYRYVLTWCKAFGVLFNSADLAELR